MERLTVKDDEESLGEATESEEEAQLNPELSVSQIRHGERPGDVYRETSHGSVKKAGTQVKKGSGPGASAS